MKKNFIKLALFIFLALVVAGALYSAFKNKKNAVSKNIPMENKAVTAEVSPNNIDNSYNISKPFKPPVANAQNRITKKPFGIKVSPGNSPVSPERFSGYHTGTDFEVLPGEQNKEVIIYAICDGEILQGKWVSGYGNILIEKCALENQPVTVLYGHLSFSGSVAAISGAKISAGDPIAVLGADKSRDTDGERKHLHLSIHKGTAIDYRGYVSSQTELANWFNPEDYIDFAFHTQPSQ